MRNLIIPATAALLLSSAAFAQTTTLPSTAPSVSGSGAMSDQERACRNIANPTDRAGCLNNLNPSALSPSVPGTTGSIGPGGVDSSIGTGGVDSGGRALGGTTGGSLGGTTGTGGSLGGSTTSPTGGTMGSGIGGTGASGGAAGASGGGR